MINAFRAAKTENAINQLDKISPKVYYITENTTGEPELKPAESGMDASLTLEPDTDNAVVGSLRQIEFGHHAIAWCFSYIRFEEENERKWKRHSTR